MTFLHTGSVLFWYRHGGDFLVLQHFINDAGHWAMNNFQCSCHFIDCYLPVFLYHSFHFSINVRPICNVRTGGVSCITKYDSQLLSFLWHSYACWSENTHIPILPSPCCNKYQQVSHFHHPRNIQLCIVLWYMLPRGAVIICLLFNIILQNGQCASVHIQEERDDKIYLHFNCLLLNLDFFF